MQTVKLLDIQRMSSEDGPGLRTTAFLKGCPLSCKWCHNPESISFKNQVVWNASRCMGCFGCVAACPERGIVADKVSISIEREKCRGCFSCSEACPSGAMEGKGRDWDVSALRKELIKDAAYFGTDGGVTLSGGEALSQSGSVELLRLLKESGVNTAIDTCGLLPQGRLLEALPYCDVLLFDVKLADSESHRRYTGAGNEVILQNLTAAGRWAASGGRLWIRTPIIPGATDSFENISGIGALLRGIPNIERWELCAFNNLCLNKYSSLGLEWAFEGVPLVSQASMADLLVAAKDSGACADTRATGALCEN